MNETGADPQSVMMVGDSLVSDVEGAEKYGLRSFWLDRKGKGRNLYDLISHLSQE